MSDESTNSGVTPDPLINQRIDIWKTTVETQQHFNGLQLQLRNLVLTLLLAVLSAAAYTIKEHMVINILGFTTSTAFVACLAGAFIVFAFYYMDWGYHQLLKGAVLQGVEIEYSIHDKLPEAGLALSISRASNAERFLGIFPSSSTKRLHCFYAFLFLALVGTAIFGHFATSSTPPPIKPATPISDAPAPIGTASPTGSPKETH